MCGIGGVVKFDKHLGFNNDIKLISLSLLLELQSRGDDAWGVYLEKTKENRGLYCRNKDPHILGQLWKVPGPVQSFFSHSEGNTIYLNDVHTMLMHTRLNTNGHPEINENNHPFNTKDFILAHNGMISNWEDLKEKHNIVTDIECDSYIIVSLIQKFYDESKSVIKAIKKTIEEIHGGFACWLYFKPKSEIYLFRSNNPLHYYMDTKNKALVFASEEGIILKAYADSDIRKEIKLIPLEHILQVINDDLKDLGTFTPNNKVSGRLNYYENQCGWDGRQTSLAPIPAQVDKLNNAFERLFLECEKYETTPHTIEFVIGVLSEGIRFLVRPEDLIKRLDSVGFVKYKRLSKVKSTDYTHYTISPPENIIELVDKYYDFHYNENIHTSTNSSSSYAEINKELLGAIGDLAKILECELDVTTSNINFIFTGIPSIVAQEFFKKLGFQHNKYNMFRIERTYDHINQLKTVLKEPLLLYEGD